MDATVINSDEGGVGGISPLILSEEKLKDKFDECNREIRQLIIIIDSEDLSLSKKSALTIYLKFLETELLDIGLKKDKISELAYF